MTTTTALTLAQVLELAKRLPPIDQVRLIERLAPQIEHALERAAAPAEKATNDTWERLNQFRDEIAADYPDAQIGDRLEADRRERQALIEESTE